MPITSLLLILHFGLLHFLRFPENRSGRGGDIVSRATGWIWMGLAEGWAEEETDVTGLTGENILNLVSDEIICLYGVLYEVFSEMQSWRKEWLETHGWRGRELFQ
ncbi:hypothetical protein ATANTOWER_017640 [Ataeniobius toweri]|uniref:Uncharacterized protein n=1 Tax=Ataeniobius toweri TaxID=208326 RepID=A0ABU7B856_9TELE|nr:hypothetical protein [Ataeniobius toweri]